MALAVASYDGTARGAVHLRIDIGTNRYYAYAIGSGEDPPEVEGFTVIKDPIYRSPVMGPVPPSARGKATIAIPVDAFERRAGSHVQLASFKTQNMSGVALSDLVPIPRGGAGSNGFPEIAFAQEVARPRVVEFQAAQPRMSQSMFWGAIAGVLQNLAPMLPQLVPAIGGLLGGILGPKQPAGQPPTAGSAVVGNITNPENLKMLGELLQKLLAGAGGPAGGAIPAAQSFSERYSEAKIAPAVLAALPALIPLLEKVLTPETVQQIIGTADPNKLIGTITNALLDIGKLGIAEKEQHLQHIRAVHPQAGAPADELLKGLGLSMAVKEIVTEPAFRGVPAVRLAFADITPQPVGGRPQASYMSGREIRFPLALETPRPIEDAMLVMRVRDADTLKVVAKRTYPIPRAGIGRLETVPSVSEAEAARLRPGRDYLVAVALTWKGKDGKRRGTSMTQLITIVREFAFDRVEQTTAVVPLDDVQTHREFWHKAWEGTFDDERRRVVLECTYHYVLAGDATDNAQMETVIDADPVSDGKEAGVLRSGLAISPYRLNALLPRISPHESLGEAELASLASDDFAARFAQGARVRVRFVGIRGRSGALWVFPEVKVQEVVLRRAEEVNDAGHVLQFGEHRVHFPMPVLAHLVGVISQ